MSSHGRATATYAQRLDDLFARISFGIMFVLLAFGALAFLLHVVSRSEPGLPSETNNQQPQ